MAKAFEILLLLVENRGEVLVKEELMGTVWAGSIVEDGNLITSRKPDDVPVFNDAIIRALSV
jgi:DNA-binding winged helix-turn-helix (wHTH) protein